MFDDLAALAPPKPAELGSELKQYLSTDVEHVSDPIMWWHERWHIYPQLSQMALDYLTIPGNTFLYYSNTFKTLTCFCSHFNWCCKAFQSWAASPFTCPVPPLCTIYPSTSLPWHLEQAQSHQGWWYQGCQSATRYQWWKWDGSWRWMGWDCH